MKHRLSDYSPEKVIPTIEESLREFWWNWGQAPQSELLDRPHMLRLYTGVPYAFFNAVICTQLLPHQVDEEIEATLSYYTARDANWEWAIGPNSNPASLEKALEKHGLAFSGEDVGMAINIHAMHEDLLAPRNVSFIQAKDDNTLKMWAYTMIEGFEAPALHPTFIDLEMALGSQHQEYRCYLGLLDQQPVSTCALYLGAEVAGIYCVSTLPAACRKGIAASITLHALKDAKAMGYTIAVLQSSPMGRNVYRQLGFQKFSTIRMYKPVE